MSLARRLPLPLALALLSCSAGKPPSPLPLVARPATPPSSSHVQVVVVIAMENHDLTEIFGNSGDAPYINDQLLPACARAEHFTNELPQLDSEPHYVWMEAGTNAFADHTFTNDDDPSASNSTASAAHLSAQLDATDGRVTWRAYQEGINSATGACPIHSSGAYAPKHDPFVFFRDVSGNPPSASNASCADHHSPLTALPHDVAADTLATYDFITPDLCNDMHGQSGCPDSNTIRAGDTWLAQNLPPLIDYVNAHAGVIFVTWDEGNNTNTMPFLAIGPGVKPGYSGSVRYDHSSLVRSLEEILGVPVLPAVSGANDLGDLFADGAFP